MEEVSSEDKKSISEEKKLVVSYGLIITVNMMI